MKNPFVLSFVLTWCGVACVLIGFQCTPGGQPVSLPAGAIAWEYKSLIINAPDHTRKEDDAKATNEIPVVDADLNKLGADRWELAASWLEMETVFPNLGTGQYVTGVQPNVRPMRTVLLFKRRTN